MSMLVFDGCVDNYNNDNRHPGEYLLRLNCGLGLYVFGV